MALTTVPVSLSATALTLTTAAQPNITSVGTLTGLTVGGTISIGDWTNAINIGASNDLQLYHVGGNSHIKSDTGQLIIRTDALRVLNNANSEQILHGDADGAVTLYYDNAAKLATASGGVTVTGTLTATTLAGTLSTAAQTNITSVGTLTGLTTSGDITVQKSSADSLIDVLGDGANDAILNLRSNQGAISTEGFQIWYDNNVGDVHLHTTYTSSDAAIRFHTRTGANKATNNERLTILGDGRAITIGEHVTQNNQGFEIQFKGSGKTKFSRDGDGKAALGPMLREYIISEAMHYLNIPTTRSLAVIKTGEDVFRESILEGAILTRIASSHIRVGTFQYALISKNKNDLKTLFDYTIKRHYPNITKSGSSAEDLLKIVLEKQINLICNWMRIGFIHGVMNTDNMTISGETIDYGPCAFMDKYDPGTVFSSIDHQGRYAYYNQPKIAKWNLERFAESLLPLIDNDSKVAIKIAAGVLKEFPEKYKNKWLIMMKKKLGLIDNNSKDEPLIIELLSWMHQNKADYTNTFCYLMNECNLNNEIYNEKNFILWKKKWEARIKLNNNSLEKSLKIIRLFVL